MALRLKLKPHERVIIGGAAVRNGRSRVELLIDNQVPVLRESELITPNEVRTPCERIYLALQLMYIDSERIAQYRSSYRALVADVVEAAPSCRPLIAAIDDSVKRGRFYQALKHARGLIDHERELIGNVR